MAGGFFAAFVPFLCGVLGAVIANAPISVTAGFLPPPLFALMPLYFWCLVRPDLMPPSAAFGLGLVQDILSATPPGTWALSFIAAYYVIDRQRDMLAGLRGWGAVLGFSAAAFAAQACAWAIVSLYYWHAVPVPAQLGALAVTALFYIPAALTMGLIHRRLIGSLRTHL